MKTKSTPLDSSVNHPAWYCLRTQPKHEHIAAAHLRRSIENMDVFNPQFKIRRQTRRGAVWFVEALFPGYLFAWFDPKCSMQAIKRTPGISTVVHFGTITPSIPEEVIADLRTQFSDNNIEEIGDDIRAGDEVKIVDGPFRGQDASVLRIMSASDRVQVLLEVLGRITPVEIDRGQIVMQMSSHHPLTMHR